MTTMEIKPRADLDMFPKLASYLDPHLVIPVLDSDMYKELGVSAFCLSRTIRIPVRLTDSWH